MQNIHLPTLNSCHSSIVIIYIIYFILLLHIATTPTFQIQQQCQLTHIISLWSILNVEQARRIAIGKEVCDN